MPRYATVSPFLLCFQRSVLLKPVQYNIPDVVCQQRVGVKVKGIVLPALPAKNGRDWQGFPGLGGQPAMLKEGMLGGLPMGVAQPLASHKRAKARGLATMAQALLGWHAEIPSLPLIIPHRASCCQLACYQRAGEERLSWPGASFGWVCKLA